MLATSCLRYWRRQRPEPANKHCENRKSTLSESIDSTNGKGRDGLEITGEFKLKGSRQEIWDVLNDPEQLAKAIPGADELIEEEPDHFRAEMSVGVGMIRGKFGGSVVVEDKVEPESYKMSVDGKGGAGWLKGEGKISLAENGADSTVIDVAGEASVGGLLARVGQRMVRNVANSLMKQFFQNVEKQAAAKRG